MEGIFRGEKHLEYLKLNQISMLRCKQSNQIQYLSGWIDYENHKLKDKTVKTRIVSVPLIKSEREILNKQSEFTHYV